MKFFKLLQQNKTTVYILTVLIVLIGISSYTALPRESAPSIKIPFVFVTTIYPGVSPQDIENLVTDKIEKEVKAISGVKKITSVSRESFSSISVEFNPDVLIDDAIQKVRDKVAVAKSEMPNDIEEPSIMEINFSELPMMYVNLTGNVGLIKLKEVGDKLQDNIEQINGVLSAEVVGGLEREVQINTDANRLKYYNVSFNDLVNVISAENLNIPGGSVEIGQSSFLIRTPGEYRDPTRIADLVVKSKEGMPIYIRDVAQVVYGSKERTTYSRENGKESVTIVVKKRSGANIIQIADAVKEIINTNDNNLIPQGITASITGDESEHINDTVHELENGIITGVILVCIILFFFMGLKNAILTATSIPLSFLISFCVLNIMGITLNIVVLFALVLVLGIIVDDAIVVIENVYRLQEKEGYSPQDAAIEAPREVVFPVTIATLTIMASFFPLLFFPGIVGEFMKFLPITLIVCLASSLFVAMVISPIQAAVFINYKRDKERSEKKKFRPVGKFLEWFDNKFFGVALQKYEKVVRWSLHHRKTSIGGVVILLVVVFFLYGGPFNTGVEFFPSVEPKQANINITLPAGTDIKTTNQVTKDIEAKLPQFEDIEYYVANVGSSNNPMDFSGSGIPNKSTITLNFYDKHSRSQSSFVTIDEVRAAVGRIPGAVLEIKQQEGGPPTGPPINIEIAGDDFELLGDLADQVIREIRDIPGAVDLKSNFDKAVPEIKIMVDRDKAALYGLSTAAIGSTIRTAVYGTEASKYRVGDEEYDISVRLNKDQKNNTEVIKNLYISNKDGVKIPLTSVANVEFSGGIGAISRKDLKRVVTVTGNNENRNANEVMAEIQAKLKNFNMPDGYMISYTGQQEEQNESSAFLGKAFMVAILLVYFLMVIEFNSVRTPLIIMFTILLSLIGVLIGLMVTQTPFGIVMTGIGVISLAGIVVRNAIVLLDFQHELMKRGMSRDESLVHAGVIRLRPIFLTAAATILGIIPLATGVDFDWRTFSWVIGGENSAFWRPMGVAIIFGLVVSTFLTLVIIPTIYAAVDDTFAKIFKRKPKDIQTEIATVGPDRI
jgi:multidrug efflux pump